MTLFAALLSLLWFIPFWLMTRDRTMSLRLICLGIMASFIGVIIAAPDIWQKAIAGYPGDSFWTLDGFGRAGVIIISTTGLTLIFGAIIWKTQAVLRMTLRITRTARVLFDVAASMLIFGVLHSLSPQVFYILYSFIFSDLGSKWVISGVFDPDRLAQIAAISPRGQMSDHLAGVALWAIAPFTIWLHLHDWRRRRLSRSTIP